MNEEKKQQRRGNSTIRDHVHKHNRSNGTCCWEEKRRKTGKKTRARIPAGAESIEAPEKKQGRNPAKVRKNGRSDQKRKNTTKSHISNARMCVCLCFFVCKGKEDINDMTKRT